MRSSPGAQSSLQEDVTPHTWLACYPMLVLFISWPACFADSVFLIHDLNAIVCICSVAAVTGKEEGVADVETSSTGSFSLKQTWNCWILWGENCFLWMIQWYKAGMCGEIDWSCHNLLLAILLIRIWSFLWEHSSTQWFQISCLEKAQVLLTKWEAFSIRTHCMGVVGLFFLTCSFFHQSCTLMDSLSSVFQ